MSSKCSQLFESSFFEKIKDQNLSKQIKFLIENCNLANKIFKSILNQKIEDSKILESIIFQKKAFAEYYADFTEFEASNKIKLTGKVPIWSREILFNIQLSHFYFPIETRSTDAAFIKSKLNPRFLIADFDPKFLALDFNTLKPQLKTTNNDKLLEAINLFFLNMKNSAITATDFSLPGFLITGKGTLKTKLMVAFANKYLATKPYNNVIFIDIRQLIYLWKNSFGSYGETAKLMYTLCNVELLIIENFGLENQSASFRDEFFQLIIRQRIRQGVFTVVLSEFSSLSAIKNHLTIAHNPAEIAKASSFAEFFDKALIKFTIK